MSYAGTYGADETCTLHDTYWRSCKWCSLVGPRATQQEIDAAVKRREEEVERLQADRTRKSSERHTYTVVKDGFGKTISETKVDDDHST